jgi:hypothetical protein
MYRLGRKKILQNQIEFCNALIPCLSDTETLKIPEFESQTMKNYSEKLTVFLKNKTTS